MLEWLRHHPWSLSDLAYGVGALEMRQRALWSRSTWPWCGLVPFCTKVIARHRDGLRASGYLP